MLVRAESPVGNVEPNLFIASSIRSRPAIVLTSLGMLPIRLLLAVKGARMLVGNLSCRQIKNSRNLHSVILRACDVAVQITPNQLHSSVAPNQLLLLVHVAPPVAKKKAASP